MEAVNYEKIRDEQIERLKSLLWNTEMPESRRLSILSLTTEMTMTGISEGHVKGFDEGHVEGFEEGYDEAVATTQMNEV